jgi:glyoxylase-like metal-dependent hydrolase (beta-lactamase superfamily II)
MNIHTHTTFPSKLVLSVALIAGSLLASNGSYAETANPAATAATAASAASPAAAVQDDYFHTGAGAHYLVRAKSPLEVQPERGNITVLLGSGGNITVLSGKDGKFLVDAGIGPSKDKVQAELKKLGPTPVKYVVNTHWHWDHTDGNAWLHAAGATIVAHENTLKHLAQTTHVDDWNWTFQPVAQGARPTLLVKDKKTFKFDGTTIVVENFGAGHTDGDVSIYFVEPDVLSLGDTFWTGGYPFIDNQDGGDINDAIKWADKTLERTTDHTILVPGHGPVGTRTDLIAFRDMLVGVRDNVLALKQQGKSLDEIIAAKPTAAFDARWNNFVIKGDHFVKLVYAGL